jgi:histidinol-phosphatase (PHP family)
MEEMPVYINKVRELQEKFKKDISIKLGIEVEYTPEIEKPTGEVLKNYDFDYIYGSTHFIGKWVFDHPAQKDEWKKRDVYEVYEEYFSTLRKMMASGLFDVVAHIDLVKKFGYRPDRSLAEIYNEVARSIVRYDLCIEINTSGLRKPVKEIYPAEELLKICFDANVPIVLGSDAHRPDEVAMDFDRALALVKKIGYKKIATFSNRKRALVNL